MRTRTLALFVILLAVARLSFAGEKWQGTWASGQMLAETKDLPEVALHDITLRQNIRISCAGTKLRVRLSNEFGDGPLEIGEATISLSGDGGAIQKGSGKALKFGGHQEISIVAGKAVTSDPFNFRVPALAHLTITLYIKSAPSKITAHPGSRTTSYLIAGDHVAESDFASVTKTDHWYFLSAVEVASPTNSGAIAILGDSITDGRGSTTNGNDRWPDILADRLSTNPKSSGIGVLNLGIGGNRLLRDGSGPRAVSRLERDIFRQSNVRWLILLEGVNDLGTRPKEKGTADPGATVDEILSAYRKIIREAHAHGIRVYGGTMTPFGGSSYGVPQNIADQQKINHWILTSGDFDAVIDFEKAVADPAALERLQPKFDSGDHLHPSAAGYKAMGNAVSLSLFEH